MANEFSISPVAPSPSFIERIAPVRMFKVRTTPSVLVTIHSNPFWAGSAEVIPSLEVKTLLRS